MVDFISHKNVPICSKKQNVLIPSFLLYFMIFFPCECCGFCGLFKRRRRVLIKMHQPPRPKPKMSDKVCSDKRDNVFFISTNNGEHNIEEIDERFGNRSNKENCFPGRISHRTPQNPTPISYAGIQFTSEGANWLPRPKCIYLLLLCIDDLYTGLWK